MNNSELVYEQDKEYKKNILSIQKFIHEELKKQNFPHPEQIQVIPSSSGPGAVHNFFLINETMQNDCIKAGILNSPLKTIFEYNEQTGEYEKKEEIWHTINAEESQRKLNEIKAIINHEASHLIANDIQKRLAVNGCLSSLTCLSGLALVRKINSYIGSTRIKGLLTTLSTLPIMCVSLFTGGAYARFQESCADEHIPNEPDYLKGGITLCEANILIEKESTPNVYDSKLLYLISDHPTSESRVNRFKERLEKLQQQKA